jgi:hypothetical protein
MSGIENLSTHFYGVQGNESIFPANVERMETREYLGIDLLTQAFEDMAIMLALTISLIAQWKILLEVRSIRKLGFKT